MHKTIKNDYYGYNPIMRPLLTLWKFFFFENILTNESGNSIVFIVGDS